MNDKHEHPGEDRRPGSVGEQNIQRLIGRAYEPETPDKDFAERVVADMLALARAQAAKRARRPAPPGLLGRRVVRWAPLAAAAAAIIALIVAGVVDEEPPLRRGDRAGGAAAGVARAAKKAGVHPALVEQMLTARPRASARPVEPVAVGSIIRTTRRHRRRAELPDGSVLYINQNTSLTITARRSIMLHRGEVYAQVVPAEADLLGSRAAFVIRTPAREVVATGTRLAVKVADGKTSVMVTQGKVQVSGLAGLLYAGQQLRGDSQRATALPRATHVLDWTKDLMAAARSPLVPKSKHAGGALVAVDPAGQEMKLSLRKYHVDVHIEDGFARTTIDQTYFNHTPSRLEGTFYFPLPPDASLSRLAMYVNGKLNEGGMVERDRARMVYESIVYKMQDPALLEWVDGTTFKMRVFPLFGRREKRIILSYTQKLPTLYGQTTYYFPAGHTMQNVGKWSFRALVKGGAVTPWQCESHDLKPVIRGRDLILDARAENVRPDADVVLHLFGAPDRPEIDGGARFSSALHEGGRYLMLRYRPHLPTEPRRRRRHWVFLFESSADRNPLLARAQIEVVRGVLENAEHDDTFALVAAATRASGLAKGPLAVSPGNISAAVEFLENSHLIGALDLGQALDLAGELATAGSNAHLVHVGAGVPVLGARGQKALLERLPGNTKYVGVGVGKRWSRSFMKAAAARTGGYYTQINPDEDVSWRAFELVSTLNTPRLLNVRVDAVGSWGGGKFLCHNDSAAQGEQVCAIMRTQDGRRWPESVTVNGVLDGKKWSARIPVRDVAKKADYLPRIRARLEIDRLLAEDAAKNREKIVNLSKAMYVMSPFTSLLVLENEAMYKQYKVDRGRKDHWALYQCPKTIPVVHEPLGSHPSAPANKEAKTKGRWQKDVLQTILVRETAPFFQAAPHGRSQGGSVTYSYAVNAWQIYAGGRAVPINSHHGFLGRASDQTGRLVRSLPRITLWNGQQAYVINYVIDRSGNRTALNFSDTFLDDIQANFLIQATQPQPLLRTFNGQRTYVVDGSDSMTAGRIASLFVNYEDIPPIYLATNGKWKGGRALWEAAALSLGRVGFYHADVPGLSDLGRWSFVAGAVSGEWSDLGMWTPVLGESGWTMAADPDAPPSLSSYGSMTYRGFKTGYGTGRGGISSFVYVPDGGTLLLGGLRNARGREIGVPLLSKIPIINRLFTNRGVVRDEFTLLLLVRPPIIIEGGETWWKEITYPQDWREIPGRRTGFRKRELRAEDSDIRMARLLISNADTERAVEMLEDAIEADPRRTAALHALGHLYARQGKTAEAVAYYRRAIALDPDSPEAHEALGHQLRERGELSAADEHLSRALAIKLRHFSPGAMAPVNLLYRRPRFTGQKEYFTNLTLHAPGLNTSGLDILAVLEAEAPEEARPKRGRIDPKAARLIATARSTGWQAVSAGPGSGQSAPVVTFDGGGRYAYARVRGGGLSERVICDGKKLLHLYEEIGLGAVRTVSRFHRARLIDAIPWLVSPAEDLATGADVRLEAERTVAITPLAAPGAKTKDGKQVDYVEIHLVFAKGGRLAERRVVLMPEGKTIGRVTYSADGAVKVLSGKGKVLAERKYDVVPAVAPDLEPDLSKLVVLPMPTRTLEHLERTRELNPGRISSWKEADALAHIAATSPDSVWAVIKTRFLNRGDRRIGFYVLLAQEQRHADLPKKLRHLPLARYLAALKRTAATTRKYEQMPDLGEGFIGRLAAFRNLWRQIKDQKVHEDNKKGAAARKAWRQAMLKYVGRPGHSIFAWALLSEAADLEGRPEDPRKLAAAFERYAKLPALNYVARYEAARALSRSSDADLVQQGRERFKKLYSETIKDGLLGSIDHGFCQAISGYGWEKLVLDAADDFIRKNARFAVIVLAYQCRQIGDGQLARQVLMKALSGAPQKLEIPLKLAAVGYYWRDGQWAAADRTISDLLADERLAEIPSIWRAAAQVASKRGRTASAVKRLDRAMDIEYRRLPEKVNVRVVRAAYGRLMGEYEKLCRATATLEHKPPKTLLAGIIRTADRWRALDADPTQACQSAAKALRSLGASELAWDYLTTPLAGKPKESGPWVSLAGSLAGDGDAELADRAYATAFEIEPTNARILWDRAQLLSRHGKAKQARRFYRQIAEGTWQPKHQSLKQQAARALTEK